MIPGSDPVEVGFVASLNRPGGNISGVSLFTSLLVAKRLVLLRELVPAATIIAFLVNPNNSNARPDTAVMQAAAARLGQQLIVLSARTEQDIDLAFASLGQRQATALVVNTDSFFLTRRNQLAALEALRNSHDPRFAGVHRSRRSDELWNELTDAYRQVGVYAARILNGEKPADLPVQQPTKYELVINLKTARALGLDVPPTLLARADEVIE